MKFVSLFITGICIFLAAAHPVVLKAADAPVLPDFSDLGLEQESTGQVEERADAPESFSVVLNPRQEAVLSAEVNACVQKIHKEFGQGFQKGDVLLTLDSRLFRLHLSQAEVLYVQRKKTFDAICDLYENQSRSIIELEDARAGFRIAEINKKVAKYDLERCTIRAPYAGRVEQVAVDEKEWVKIGDSLVKIVNDAVLLARTLVPASLLQVFSIGSTVEMELTGGRKVHGKVSHIGAVMDSASQTFEVKIEVPNPDGSLRSGMTGKIIRPAAQGAGKREKERL